MGQMPILHWSAFITALAAAELLLLIIRSKDIIALAKSASQRTETESLEISRGLGRSIVLEIALFVPASALLLTLISPIVFGSVGNSDELYSARYALIGIASYGFPFATIKKTLTDTAMKLLQAYALSIAQQHPPPSPQPRGSRQQ